MESISLTVDSTTRKLPLARDNGALMWKTYEMASPGSSSSEPLFTQTDWSGGFGQGDFQDPNRYSVGSTIDTSHKGALFLGPNVESASVAGGANLAYAPLYWAMFDSSLYMAAGDIYKWSTVNSRWDVASTLGSTAAGELCVHNGYMFVAIGGTNSYYYTSDGSSFTTSTTTDADSSAGGPRGHYFISMPPLSGTTPVLWKAYYNKVYSSTTGINGDTWTQAYYIGDDSSSIRRLMNHQGSLFIGKSDGLYHLDEDGVVHKLLHAQVDPKSTNFQTVTTLKGAIYFSFCGRIGEITSYNSFDLISPFQDMYDVDKADSACYGLAADEENLYAAMYITTTLREIYKGTQDSSGTWHWSHCASTGAMFDDGQCLFFGPSLDSGHPRLWFGSGSTACKYIKVIRDPLVSSYLYNDSPSFTSSGYIETGWLDMGHRDWYKLIDSVLAEAKMNSGAMSATKYVRIAYATDDSSTFTTIGDITTATMGSKKYVATAPASAKKIKFRITLATDSSSVTPIVKYFAAYGTVRPTRVQGYEFTVACETTSMMSAKTMRDFLVSARDNTSYCTLVDRYGSSHYVRVLPGYPQEVEYIDQNTKQPAMGMKMVCEKVDWA